MTLGCRQKKTSAALQTTTSERPGEAITIQSDFLLKKKKKNPKQTTRGHGKCKKTVDSDLEAAKMMPVFLKLVALNLYFIFSFNFAASPLLAANLNPCTLFSSY